MRLLPKSETKKVYDLVDEAIKVIRDSGLKYKVCPLETVVEGSYKGIMQIVEKVLEKCLECGADELMGYIKIQSQKEGKVTIEDKIAKYD